MSWTRLDDTWTDLPELSALDHQVRWHYLAMIQFCSRTGRYDGILKLADARRCSDVDDPVAAISTLAETQLLIHLPSNHIKVGRIDDHIPPPSVRESKEKTKNRVRRHRLHKNGDHSECLAENCDQVSANTSTGEVTGDVTRYTRTGQDRTGQDMGSAQNDASDRHTTDFPALDESSVGDSEVLLRSGEIDPDSGAGSADPFAWFSSVDREAS